MKPAIRLCARWSALVLALGAVAGCFDPVVSAPCDYGLSPCEGVCIDLAHSQDNCGACNAVCEGACRGGVCIVLSDAADPGVPSEPEPDAAVDEPVATPDVAIDRPGDLPGDRTGDATDGTQDRAGDAGDAIGDGGGDGPGDGADGDAGDGASAGDGPTDQVASDDGAGSDGPGAVGGAGAGGAGGGAGAGGAGAGGGAGGAAMGGAGGVVSVPPDAAVDADAADAADAAIDAVVEAGVPIVCSAGLHACDDRCVLLSADPDNCGVCGNRCASGQCVSGVCQQQGTGHVVVIGHDFVVNRSGMNNLLGNAVLLSASDPIAVLAYQGDATLAAIAGADQAINQVAMERGRSWLRTTGTSSLIINSLQAYDVLVIYAQAGSSDATLLAAGQAWAAALTTFVSSGKTVVVLDTPTSSNAGTFQILTAAGLFGITSHADVTGQSLVVVAGGDAIAQRVPRGYRAEMSSVSYMTTTPVTTVVTTVGGAPVVIHRTF